MKSVLLSFLWMFGAVGVLALGSKAPKVMGIILVIISPTVGLSYNNGPSLPVYIFGGFLVCWGLYNIFVLGKNSCTYRHVLLSNIAIPLVAVAIFLVNIKLL